MSGLSFELEGLGLHWFVKAWDVGLKLVKVSACTPLKDNSIRLQYSIPLYTIRP